MRLPSLLLVLLLLRLLGSDCRVAKPSGVKSSGVESAVSALPDLPCSTTDALASSLLQVWVSRHLAITGSSYTFSRAAARDSRDWQSSRYLSARGALQKPSEAQRKEDAPEPSGQGASDRVARVSSAFWVLASNISFLFGSRYSSGARAAVRRKNGQGK